MPISSQEIKDRLSSTEADRPYRTGEERAAHMRGLVGLGRSQGAQPPDVADPQTGDQGGPSAPGRMDFAQPTGPAAAPPVPPDVAERDAPQVGQDRTTQRQEKIGTFGGPPGLEPRRSTDLMSAGTAPLPSSGHLDTQDPAAVHAPITRTLASSGDSWTTRALAGVQWGLSQRGEAIDRSPFGGVKNALEGLAKAGHAVATSGLGYLIAEGLPGQEQDPAAMQRLQENAMQIAQQSGSDPNDPFIKNQAATQLWNETAGRLPTGVKGLLEGLGDPTFAIGGALAPFVPAAGEAARLSPEAVRVIRSVLQGGADPTVIAANEVLGFAGRKGLQVAGAAVRGARGAAPAADLPVSRFAADGAARPPAEPPKTPGEAGGPSPEAKALREAAQQAEKPPTPIADPKKLRAEGRDADAVIVEQSQSPRPEGEPPLATGHVRLYRAVGKSGLGPESAGTSQRLSGQPERVRFFSPFRDYAEKGFGQEEGSRLVYVDVPIEQAQGWAMGNRPDILKSLGKTDKAVRNYEVAVPSDIAKKSRGLSTTADIAAAKDAPIPAEQFVPGEGPPTSPYDGKRITFPTPSGVKSGTVLAKIDATRYAVKADDGTYPIIDHFTPEPTPEQAIRDQMPAANAIDRAALNRQIDREYGKGPYLRPAAVKTEPVTVTETYMSPEDAAQFAKLGPISARDDAFHRATGINPAYVDPTVRARVGDAFARAPDRFVRTKVPDTAMVQRVATLVGLGSDKLMARLREMGLTDPGEASAYIGAVGETMAQMAKDLTDLHASGAPAEDIAAAEDSFATFAGRVGGAASEWGRMGRALQMQRSLDFVGAIKQRQVVVNVARMVRVSEKKVARAQANIDRATAKQDASLQDLWQRTLRRETNALEKANATYATASDRLAELGQKAKTRAYMDMVGKDPALAEAIAALKPGDINGLVKLIQKGQKWTPSQKYVAMVISGALSGPPGHLRSAASALTNAVTDVMETTSLEGLGAIAKIVGADPVVNPSEFKGTLFGILHGVQNFPRFAGDFWSGIDPQLSAGIEDMSGTHGYPFSGKGQVAILGSKLHGFYHATQFHFSDSIAFDSMAYGQAVRDAGPKASGDAVGALYEKYVTEMPDSLMQKAGNLAQSRSLLSRQNAVAEAVLNGLSSIDRKMFGGAAVTHAVFIAARFGFGGMSRFTQLMGGGLLRGGKMLTMDRAAMERTAIAQQARLAAMRDMGAGTMTSDPAALAARIAELTKKPTPEINAAALARTATQRDALTREALKVSVQGATGALLLGGGLMMAGAGRLKRNGFSTNLYDEQGKPVTIPGTNIPLPLEAFFPYSAPWIAAALLQPHLVKGQVKQEDLGSIVSDGADALANLFIDGTSLSMVLHLASAISSPTGQGDKRAYEDLGDLYSRFVLPGVSVVSRNIDQWMDPLKRQTPNSMGEAILYYLPIARRALLPQTDALGRPIPSQGSLPTSPVLTKDAEMVKAVPTYKALTPYTRKSYGTLADKVDFTEIQTSDLSQLAGHYRDQALSALLTNRTFQTMKPADQAKKWKAAALAADRAALGEFTLGLALKGGENTAKYVKIAENSVGPALRSRALWIEALQRSGKLTPPIISALDTAARPSSGNRQADPTVAQYLAAAPLIRSYISTPQYTTGNAAEWAAYAKEHAAYTRLQRTDPPAAQKMLLGSTLLRKYYGGRYDNPARAKIIAAAKAQHMDLTRFLSGLSASATSPATGAAP